MIFSKSSEYAIRAFLYLADHEPGKLVMAKQIAEDAGLPSHFLAKLLQQLARKGLVKSNKGPSGGFMLSLAPKDITLYRIVEAVDGVESIVNGINGTNGTNGYHNGNGHANGHGNGHGNGHSHIAPHDGWIEVRSRIVDYLERTSLATIHRTVSTSRKKKAVGARG